MENITINKGTYDELIRKAAKYDEINEAVAAFYPEDEDEEVGDLVDIGEKVCNILGWM